MRILIGQHGGRNDYVRQNENQVDSTNWIVRWFYSYWFYNQELAVFWIIRLVWCIILRLFKIHKVGVPAPTINFQSYE